eukprot:189864-Pleurochrysis_carterae.AAC.2
MEKQRFGNRLKKKAERRLCRRPEVKASFASSYVSKADASRDPGLAATPSLEGASSARVSASTLRVGEHSHAQQRALRSAPFAAPRLHFSQN